MYERPTARRTTTTRRRYIRRTRVYKKRSALPTRYYGGSRKVYRKRRTFGKQLNTLGETKLRPCDNLSEVAPVQIQAAAQAYFFACNIGPTALFTGSNPINGIQTSQGVAYNERIGNYLYFKKTHLTMRIEMTTGTSNPPIQFRLIMFKIRRSVSPSGLTASWASDGFLSTDGFPFGHASSGITGLDLVMQPLNKRDWVIYKDTKFILQNYNDVNLPPSTIYNHYPASKEYQFNMPYYKKTYIPPSGLSPSDLNFSYGVVLYAHTLARDNFPANGFEVTTRGTTSFCDP